MTAELVRRPADQVSDDVRRRVDRRLATFLDAHQAVVSDPDVEAAHRALRAFVLTGGKRLRPLLCYWGWRGAGGADSEEIISACTALELCHAGLLIHDDIMDGSALRRGRPTLHRDLAAGRSDGFGQSAAILLGVLALAWSEELLAGCGVQQYRLRAAQRLFNALRGEVITGQFLDVLAGEREQMTVRQALEVVRFKTAKYTVERPLQIGGALAGADPALLEVYSGFGVPLGEAFQLRDDVLGMFGDPLATGKSALDDLREGKHTVLIAHTLHHASPRDVAHLKAWHGNADLTEERAAELRQIVVRTGALAHVEALIGERVGEALGVLGGARLDPAAEQALTALAERLAHRDR